ncbi:MAG: PKD domain-containing protein [Bacteroidia bacterium]|nr:PKD domain-containing protein [Bacteroidia bacterium]
MMPLRNFRFLRFLPVVLGGLFGQAVAQPVADFTTSNSRTGCAPFSLVVSFQDISAGSPTSWFWSFGDPAGSTSTLQNPTFVYTTPGCYTVSLTATNAQGSNTLTRSCYVQIFPQPEPGFQLADNEGCAPFTVTLIDTSAANAASITDWVYVLSNGFASTQPNPVFTFTTAPDTVSIALTVTNSNGCQATQIFSNVITVLPELQADFTVSNNAACNPPLNVTFANTTQAGGAVGISYEWQFPGGTVLGGGSTSNAAVPPPVTYGVSGQFDVTLIATSANGCRDTMVKNDFIGIGGVVADFTVSDQTVCIGDTVTFTSTSSGGVSSLGWNFGDAAGVQASNQVVPYVYGAPGVYTITLQANNAQCGDTVVRTNFVTVSPRPVANFSANRYADCQPGTPFQFTDLSTGGVTSRQWDFGDGSPVSALANPSHTFTSFGIFSVCLTVTNAQGCTDVFCDTISIRPPIAAFEIQPASGCAPLSVQFTDNSFSPTDPVTSWQWNFGTSGVAPATSTLEDPSAVFSNTGLYSIRLIIVTQSGCRDTLVRVNSVRVGDATQAAFTVDKDTVCVNEPLTFISTFTNPSWEYLWDFQYSAPGNFISQGDTVNTAYSDTGTYSVGLIVNFNGCRDTAIIDDLIFVSPPIAEFTPSTTLVCGLPGTVSFTDESVGPYDVIRWEVNGALYSTLQTPPPLTVSAIGTYTVSQIVENTTTGCVDSFAVQIFAGNPIANFTAQDSIDCKPFLARFVNLSQNATSYSWRLLENSFQNFTQVNPAFVYPDTGAYDIRLIAIDQFGCRDTLIKPDFIRSIGPYAAFSGTPVVGCPPLPVQFTDETASFGTTVNGWQWIAESVPGTAAAQNPLITFTGPGSFDITLRVVDNQGCRDTLTLPDYVIVTFPVPDFGVNDDTTCAGNPLQFTSLAQGVGLSHLWRFGDGQTDTAANPVHAYADTGSYDVTLIVTDANGCSDSVTYANFIYIEYFQANFFGDPRIGICPPLSTQFTDSTIGNVTAWFWDFDLSSPFGSPITSDNPTPGYVYLSPGSFDVQLVAQHQDGCRDTVIKQDYVIVAGPNGSFTFDNIQVCLGDSICITAVAQGAFAATFDFRDGFVQTVTGLTGFNDTTTVCHVYQNAGSYSPVVVLQDIQGCVFTLTTPDSAVVFNLPVAQIQPQDTLGCSPLTVPLRDASIPGDSAIVSWAWDFGDGGFSTAQNPVHEFFGDAPLTVQLNVIDQNGCRDSVTTTVTPREGAIPNFRASDTVGCAPVQIQFTDLSTNATVTGWTWDFGDGTGTTGVPNPAHTYQQDGVYTVSLIIQDNLGCTDTIVRTNYIRLERPDARLLANDTLACNPTTLTLYADSSSGPFPFTSFEWCFVQASNGARTCVTTGGTVDTLVRQFTVADIYNITVSVRDQIGCRDTSEVLQVFVIPRLTPPPVEVRNVTVVDRRTAELRWAPYAGTDFVSYAIYRLNGPGAGLIGTRTAQADTDFVESNPALDFEGASYCYKVLVENECGEFSLLAATEEHCTINLETTPQLDAIRLNWTAYVGYPVGQYEIYRVDSYDPTAVPFQIGVVAGTQLEYIDRETFCRDSISYRVSAVGFAGPDQLSRSDLDANRPIHNVPTESVHMTVATVVADEDVSVLWPDYTGYRPSEYILERSLDGTAWSLVDTFPLSVTSYLDTTTLVDEQSYYYRVFALDECGDLSARGRVGRSILLNLNLDATGSFPILTWNPYERWGLGVFNYQIEVLSDATGLFEQTAIVGNMTLTYRDELTQLDQPTYCYRIRAFEVGGNNAESVSNEQCVTFGPAVFAPSAFTPNNDGKNDRFLVFAPNAAAVELAIYNRWGEELYFSTNLDEGWDGTYRGRPVQEGVYVFRISLTGVDGSRLSRSGTVTLLR